MLDRQRLKYQKIKQKNTNICEIRAARSSFDRFIGYDEENDRLNAKYCSLSTEKEHCRSHKE